MQVSSSDLESNLKVQRLGSWSSRHTGMLVAENCGQGLMLRRLKSEKYSVHTFYKSQVFFECFPKWFSTGDNTGYLSNIIQFI